MEVDPTTIRSRRIFDQDDAANYLRASRSKLARMRMDGDGPEFFKIGMAVRYTREALDEWIKRNSMTVAPSRPRRQAA